MVLIKSKPETALNNGLLPYSFNSILNTFFEESKMPQAEFNFLPQADILENEKQVEIRMSLAGIRKEDVNVTMEGELLTISGERKQDETSADGSRFLKREISYGKFSRSFNVGKSDVSAISAEFTDGILKISIPKPEIEKPATITIK